MPVDFKLFCILASFTNTMAEPADFMPQLLECARTYSCVFPATTPSEQDHVALQKCVRQLPCLKSSMMAEIHSHWVQHFGQSFELDASIRQDRFADSVREAIVASLENTATSYSYFSQFAETQARSLLVPMTRLSIRDTQRTRPTPTSDPIPAAHDWHSLGFTLPIQDQYLGKGVSTAGCGSCWAFSATGAISGAHWMMTKEVKELSVQQLVDCDRNNETYPMIPDIGCGGGEPSTAFHDLEVNGTALVSAEAYPYVAKDQPCNVPSSGIMAWSRVKSHNILGDGDEQNMAATLVKFGPLSAGIDALAMPRYKKGILDPWFWQCNGANINHAVLIIGYGVDSNKAYWRIQNSWGVSWGEGGFFRLVRGKRACGIDEQSLYPVLADSDTALVVV